MAPGKLHLPEEGEAGAPTPPAPTPTDARRKHISQPAPPPAAAAPPPLTPPLDSAPSASDVWDNDDGANDDGGPSEAPLSAHIDEGHVRVIDAEDEFPPEEDPALGPPPEVPVVCNGLTGTFRVEDQMFQCACSSCDRKATRGAPLLMTPTEFERHAGMAASKKWKYSVRVVLRSGNLQATLGRWMDHYRIATKYNRSSRPSRVGRADGKAIGVAAQRSDELRRSSSRAAMSLFKTIAAPGANGSAKRSETDGQDMLGEPEAESVRPGDAGPADCGECMEGGEGYDEMDGAERDALLAMRLMPGSGGDEEEVGRDEGMEDDEGPLAEGGDLHMDRIGRDAVVVERAQRVKRQPPRLQDSVDPMNVASLCGYEQVRHRGRTHGSSMDGGPGGAHAGGVGADGEPPRPSGRRSDAYAGAPPAKKPRRSSGGPPLVARPTVPALPALPRRAAPTPPAMGQVLAGPDVPQVLRARRNNGEVYVELAYGGRVFSGVLVEEPASSAAPELLISRKSLEAARPAPVAALPLGHPPAEVKSHRASVSARPDAALPPGSGSVPDTPASAPWNLLMGPFSSRKPASEAMPAPGEEFESMVARLVKTGPPAYACCCVCGRPGAASPDVLPGHLILARTMPKQLLYVHEACVRLSSWSHERSINLPGIIQMALQTPCEMCGETGATLKCMAGECQRSYHLMCAQACPCYLSLAPAPGCLSFFCTVHAGGVPPSAVRASAIGAQGLGTALRPPPSPGSSALPHAAARQPHGPAAVPGAPGSHQGSGSDAPMKDDSMSAAKGTADALGVLGAAAFGLSEEGEDREAGGEAKGRPRAVRCRVCVKQRKGRCGTDSAPRNCARRKDGVPYASGDDEEATGSGEPHDRHAGSQGAAQGGRASPARSSSGMQGHEARSGTAPQPRLAAAAGPRPTPDRPSVVPSAVLAGLPRGVRERAAHVSQPRVPPGPLAPQLSWTSLSAAPTLRASAHWAPHAIEELSDLYKTSAPPRARAPLPAPAAATRPAADAGSRGPASAGPLAHAAAHASRSGAAQGDAVSAGSDSGKGAMAESPGAARRPGLDAAVPEGAYTMSKSSQGHGIPGVSSDETLHMANKAGPVQGQGQGRVAVGGA